MKKKKILIGIVITICIIISGIGIYIETSLNKTQKTPLEENKLGIVKKENTEVKSIALFGIDAVEGELGRSDSIMIISMDDKHKNVKISSLVRDSYVDIDGHGKDKLNHAYAFGGPELAIKTINQNFQLDVDDFVSVNFSTLPKIIDIVGGVEVEVYEDEVENINDYIQDNNHRNNTNSLGIDGPGVQTLNGTQALAYCRIRYTEGGDIRRTERQRAVIANLMEKTTELSVTNYPKLINEILPMVETSLTNNEMIKLASKGIGMVKNEIGQKVFPSEELSESEIIDGIYYLTFDKEATAREIHEYIYE